MQIFLIIIHVIVCLFLIAVILLQAGRGGGLSDIGGGSQTQSILGTETNTFMKRMTEIFAVVFIITSLALGIISTHRGKSLIEQKRMTRNFKKRIPIPVESPSAQSAARDVVPSSAPASAVKPDVPPAASAVTPVTVASAAVSTTAAKSTAEAKTSAEGNAK